MTKKVLLVSDGIFHPPFQGRMALHNTLAEIKGWSFQHTRSLEQLPGNLEEYAALVIYIHHEKISEAALATLDLFVSAGGGILGIHSATASFKGQSHYFEILGGRFTGHGAVEDFEVIRTRQDIFGGIDRFVVKDELYLHELQPGIEVHFTAKHAGEDVPVVWTYQYGLGRVCYAVPGHTTATMRDKSYQQVLQRGLIWVCKENS